MIGDVLLDGGADGGAVAHVAKQRRGVGASCADGIHCGFGRAAGIADHVVAIFGKGQRNGLADAARRSGHQHTGECSWFSWRPSALIHGHRAACQLAAIDVRDDASELGEGGRLEDRVDMDHQPRAQ